MEEIPPPGQNVYVFMKGVASSWAHIHALPRRAFPLACEGKGFAGWKTSGGFHFGYDNYCYRHRSDGRGDGIVIEMDCSGDGIVLQMELFWRWGWRWNRKLKREEKSTAVRMKEGRNPGLWELFLLKMVDLFLFLSLSRW
jgi:hypothetical protein